MSEKEKTRVYFFDKMYTQDGHELYWLHSRTEDDYKVINGTRYPTNSINPDELYVNEYDFYDACEDIVKADEMWNNYAVPQNLIDEWESFDENEITEEDNMWI
tara:strand:- start:301 stop:609 length:309 start_codon:yes stop_codon:yes gene_type:complete